MIMNELELQEFPIRLPPKLSFGRIFNKYLIIEIYSLAYLTREEAMFRLFKHHRSSRSLLIKMYYYLRQLIPHSLKFIKINFNDFDSNSESKFNWTITSNYMLGKDLKLDMIACKY